MRRVRKATLSYILAVSFVLMSIQGKVISNIPKNNDDYFENIVMSDDKKNNAKTKKLSFNSGSYHRKMMKK